ncbi:DUF1772 domain-containing protein [Pendulispora brunnea]|uniref:DUF1772 domain-containing protein n=1 Tax=Pendulispora brunnea TaxID=2905690 RepID=A0ABZ2K7G7_9BACT
MNEQTMRVLTMVALLGSALVAGVFFAFSTFVMKGLGYLPAARGAEAMNAINVAAPTAGLMSAMFGTALVCLVLGSASVIRMGGDDGALYRVLGCAVYMVTILVTIFYHVPRNDALAALDPASAEGMAYWKEYLVQWTTWNHVRTVAPLAAAALLAIALRKAG